MILPVHENHVEKSATEESTVKHNGDIWRRTSNTMLSLNSLPPPEHKEIKQQSEEKTNYNKEWLKVAAVFDRLFLITLALAIFAISAMLFKPLIIRKWYK